MGKMDFVMEGCKKSTHTRVVIKPASEAENVGLWKATKGHKVYRTKSYSDLATFLKKLVGASSIEIDRRVLSSGEYFPILRTPRIKILVDEFSMDALLPPWLDGLKGSLPDVDQVYPPEKEVYPPIEQVFSGLWFNPSSLKVLIIGQDPYHGPGQAHGLAFSYRGQPPLPPSLVNIFKENQREDSGFSYENGDLTPWFKQGVAMINTSFTVIRGSPDSLTTQWSEFSSLLFQRLSEETSHNLVVLAWGRKAQDMAKIFTKAKILRASHPSPFSVNHPPNPFAGCNHFRLANDHLRSKGITPIVWHLSFSPDKERT